MNELSVFININTYGSYYIAAESRCTNGAIIYQLENSDLNEIIIYVYTMSHNTCAYMISTTHMTIYEKNTDTYKDKKTEIKISKTTLHKEINVNTKTSMFRYHVIDKWLEQCNYMFK